LNLNVQNVDDVRSNTYEYTLTISDAKPFLFVDNTFLHVCSYADMLLLPEDIGTSCRKDAVTLIFRSKETRQQSLEQIQIQLQHLEALTLSPHLDQIFFSSWEV